MSSDVLIRTLAKEMFTGFFFLFLALAAIFSYFFQKTEFDISCKLSPLETICMKCQILFSGKNKKNIINLSSAELAQGVVKVKYC